MNKSSKYETYSLIFAFLTLASLLLILVLPPATASALVWFTLALEYYYRKKSCEYTIYLLRTPALKLPYTITIDNKVYTVYIKPFYT